MRQAVKFFCTWRKLVPRAVYFLVLAWIAPVDASILLSQAKVTVLGNPPLTTEAVTLPYLWDRSQPGNSSVAEFAFDFNMDEVAPEPYGLYAAKIANGYEVRLNGKRIERFGSMTGRARDDSKLPRVIALGYALQPGHNDLRIWVRGDAGRQGGLSPLLLGTMTEVQSAYSEVWLWRVPARFGVVVFSALVGTMGLALWLSQSRTLATPGRRRDPLYLYMGLAELCWVFRVADSIIESPPLPVAWWSVLSSLALGAWACLTTLFCMELVGWANARWAGAMRAWLIGILLAGVVSATAAWVFIKPLTLTIWYGVLGITFLLFCGAFAWKSLFRLRRLDTGLMAFAIAANVFVGLLDLYVLRIHPSVSGSSALYFSSVLFGLAASVVVLLRFRHATSQAAHLQANLALQVAQKEQALEATYERMTDLMRQQAQSTERTRILRDMHDGVGMHLSLALRQLQSGRTDSNELLETLQEGLDHLKMSIDALNLPPGDVTALLANLRYRLEPRLNASGVELRWNVELLRPNMRLDSTAMRHILFMVYESVSNVLQHSRAGVLCIEASQSTNGIRVSLIDDGVGFDVTTPPRKGLQSMRERALAIGVELSFRSTPGHTEVTILIA